MRESLIQSAIENYLRLMENLGKCLYLKNNSGAFKAEHGSFIRFGRAGSSDFIVFLPAGRCIHLEVKNETGKQNDNQLVYQTAVEKLGHRYYLVRSVDEVEKLLK